MPIFDRYIILKFLKTFFFSAFMFTIIAVVIDFSDNIDEFIKEDIPFEQVITQYYFNFIPWINGILWPLFVLMAVVFFTSRLAKNSEIVASLSSGMSFARLLRPYIATALLIALVHFLGSHYFIPKGNKRLMEFDNKYIHQTNEKTKASNIHLFLDPDSKIYIRSYRKRDTSARGIFLERFEGSQLRYILKADRMHWNGPPNRWTLKDYEVRTFMDREETLLLAQGQALDTTLNLSPQDFIWYTNEKEMMTTWELRDFIAYQKEKGLSTARSMIVEIYRRSADPFTIIILTVIGMAVSARKVRGGIGLHLALGISIGAFYIIMSRFSITFASQLDIPAGLAVWIPNMIFTGIATFLIFKAQK